MGPSALLWTGRMGKKKDVKNWVCFSCKSEFLAQNRGKLGLFCIKKFFCALVQVKRLAGAWLGHVGLVRI